MIPGGGFLGGRPWDPSLALGMTDLSRAPSTVIPNEVRNPDPRIQLSMIRGNGRDDASPNRVVERDCGRIAYHSQQLSGPGEVAMNSSGHSPFEIHPAL